MIGWDKRYKCYSNGEARLVIGGDNVYFMVSKRIHKPEKYKPREVLAADVNENHIVVGSKSFEVKFETFFRRALHCKFLAKRLRKKYSSPRYNAWRRSDSLRRIKALQAKAKNVVLD